MEKYVTILYFLYSFISVFYFESVFFDHFFLLNLFWSKIIIVKTLHNKSNVIYVLKLRNKKNTGKKLHMHSYFFRSIKSTKCSLDQGCPGYPWLFFDMAILWHKKFLLKFFFWPKMVGVKILSEKKLIISLVKIQL